MPPARRRRWSGLADFFNAIFLVVLVINFYGSSPSRVLEVWRASSTSSPSVVGTISLARVDMGPGALMRRHLDQLAFRVFRLFKRIKSLNKIIVSLGKAIPGVANAFLIMVIFMCIFAILGVEFFSQFYPDGTMTTYQDHGQHRIDSRTHGRPSRTAYMRRDQRHRRGRRLPCRRS